MGSFRSLANLVPIAGLLLLAACNGTPTAEQSPAASSPSATASTAAANHSGHGSDEAKININTAILSELDKLEGKLGIPALSNRIQASRPYASPEELVTKKVVTADQFNQIKDMVTIEDVVLTGAAKDADYMTKLGLMKGHLLVAKELLDQQQPKQAEPHIGHPVEEIYADVEDQLQERNVKEFKTTLISLQDMVKAGAKDSAQVQATFTAAEQAIDAAIQALPATQRESPEFTLRVIDGLLDAADAEYQAAIANGKISAAIEYQDSRGFVLYAQDLYKDAAGKLTQTAPDTQQAMAKNFAELTQAWPAVIPPATPVKSPEQVSQLVKAIEQESQKVIK